ncbi:hypothetical protein [Bifidobacterium simiarum]|uniref:hypothetical protein n=1 Tax=Bifidobacterium simiarum TaxID=2045441 RepID=UPI001BDC3449|nr:hypothetical protein [Bifidobacterium simiarum]MBT1166187.1 hypothetical protein [Bifidobacterium simiarum]
MGILESAAPDTTDIRSRVAYRPKALAAQVLGRPIIVVAMLDEQDDSCDDRDRVGDDAEHGVDVGSKLPFAPLFSRNDQWLLIPV